MTGPGFSDRHTLLQNPDLIKELRSRIVAAEGMSPREEAGIDDFGQLNNLADYVINAHYGYPGDAKKHPGVEVSVPVRPSTWSSDAPRFKIESDPLGTIEPGSQLGKKPRLAFYFSGSGEDGPYEMSVRLYDRGNRLGMTLDGNAGKTSTGNLPLPEGMSGMSIHTPSKELVAYLTSLLHDYPLANAETAEEKKQRKGGWLIERVTGWLSGK